MITLTATGKTVDTSPLQGRLTQGERNVDAVKIVLPRRYDALDLTALVFTLYARTQTGAGAEYSMLPTATEDTVEVIWLVTDAFTAEAGPLELELRGYSSEATLQPVIIFQMGTVTEKPSVANKLRAASAADQVILDEARKAAAQSAQSAAASDAALEKAKQVGNRVNVYSTVEELTAAEKNPWHGAMAGAGDHFYYYSGTQWVQGAPMGMDARNKAAGNPATGDALNAEKVLGTDKIMTLDGTGSIGIPANTDLNDAQYRNWGKYRSGSDVNTRTLKNAPFTEAFGMIVYPGGHTNEYPVQEAFRIVDGLTRHRTWNTYTDSWFSGWRETAQTETMRLTLINGWVAYADAFVPWASRSGNVVTINAFIKNPSQVSEFTMIPFRLPYERVDAAANTYAVDYSSKALYRFEIGSTAITPGETIPANKAISLCFSYSCK